jgi:hypothetical protein
MKNEKGHLCQFPLKKRLSKFSKKFVMELVSDGVYLYEYFKIL